MIAQPAQRQERRPDVLGVVGWRRHGHQAVEAQAGDRPQAGDQRRGAVGVDAGLLGLAADVDRGEHRLHQPERGGAATELGAELDKVRAALKALLRRPGTPRAAIDDIESQLGHVAPPDVLRATSEARLVHLGRYLRAVDVRLQRLSHDPQKDAQKATQVSPLWREYVGKRDELLRRGRSRAELDELGWLIEELRVQIFAPELKTAVPVSVARVADLWKALSR